MIKLGDTVTVVADLGQLRIAHVTNVYTDGRIGAAATSYRRQRRVYSWSGILSPTEEGLQWVRGSHASKGKPITAAGRALAAAWSLSTLRTA